MDQKHDYYKDQHHDSPAQNDQQHSRYYDTYSIYNLPHQSENLQNMQPPEKRARHSYQQSSSYYYNYFLHNNCFNSNYEYQQAPSYYDNYSSHNNHSNSNYEQQQQQQQFYPYYYHSNYTNTSLYNPEQENMNNPAASNTIATTSPPALSIDIGTLILLDESENNAATISDDESNSDNSNSSSKYKAEENEDKEDKSYDYEFEDDEIEIDSDSVTSYHTAPSEHIDSDEDEEDEDNENSATLLSDIHSTTGKMEWEKGKHFMNLIEKYGEEPGVKQMEGALEHHHIKLPIQTMMFLDKPDATKWATAVIHKFSKVNIRIVTRDRPYIMKISGTLGQCYYSIKAMDAILLDHVRFTTNYVLLRIDGPCFKQQAKNIKNVLSTIVPDEQYISGLEDLHVTVAKVPIKTDKQMSRLINTIREAGEELREALQEDHFIGRFNQVYDISDTYVGVSSARKNTDSIGVIRKVLQDKLKAAGLFEYVTEVGNNMHMTLYLSRKINAHFRTRTLLTKKKLERALIAQGIELDYEPTMVTRIEVSRRAISLSAPFRHVSDFSFDL